MRRISKAHGMLNRSEFMYRKRVADRAEIRKLVVFALDGQRYALMLESVERLVRMVDITAIPKTTEIVIGLINYEGLPIPVLDMRTRFSLPRRTPDWNDQLIIARAARRTVCLVVDSVIGVIERSLREIVPAQNIVPGMVYVSGVTKLDEGIVFIHDLDSFLSLEEENSLDGVLTQAG